MANTIYSKDFSKKMFFEAVMALAQEAGNEQVEACAEYELDKLAEAATKAASKRGTSAASTGRLCSNYAVELAKAVFTVLDKTPKTQIQIVEALAGKTINGKEIKNSPWVASVLNALAGSGKPVSDEEMAAINPNGTKVMITMQKEQKVDSKGLVKEALVKAFCLA